MANGRTHIIHIVKSYLSEGHERSIRAKRNILASFVFRGTGMALNLILVPVMLGYLNPVRYGIWLTVLSIVGWFSLADLGLGNGLRNRFAEAIARNDRALARKYVSTAYVVLACIVFGLYCVFLAANPFFNWERILNAPHGMSGELSILAYIVFTLFLLQVFLRLIGVILIADQKSAYNDFLEASSILLSFVIIFTLSRTTSGSLLSIGGAVGASYVVAFLIATVVFFRNGYREFTPSLGHVDFTYAKDLTGLSFRFFVLQIAGVVMNTKDNIIIAQLFGPSEVIPYYIALKYFSILTMVFSVILFPFWSAYTNAYYKGDFDWIRRITKKLLYLWILLAVASCAMICVSGFAYHIWVGDAVNIPFRLSVLMACFAVITMWNAIFGYFASGIGKIRLQLFIALFTILVSIPLSILLGRMFGISGVILGTNICLLAPGLLLPIQYRKIIQGKSSGIWDK